MIRVISVTLCFASSNFLLDQMSRGMRIVRLTPTGMHQFLVK